MALQPLQILKTPTLIWHWVQERWEDAPLQNFQGTRAEEPLPEISRLMAIDSHHIVFFGEPRNDNSVEDPYWYTLRPRSKNEVAPATGLPQKSAVVATWRVVGGPKKMVGMVHPRLRPVELPAPIPQKVSPRVWNPCWMTCALCWKRKPGTRIQMAKMMKNPRRAGEWAKTTKHQIQRKIVRYAQLSVLF